MSSFVLSGPPTTTTPPTTITPTTLPASSVPSTISEATAALLRIERIGQGLLALSIACLVAAVAVLAARRA